MLFGRWKNGAFASAIGCCVVLSVMSAEGEPAIRRSFNGPDTAWSLWNTGIAAQVLAQECIPGGIRDTNGFERIVVAAGAGQSALLTCPIPRVAVLDELQVRLWIKAARPDVQLATRVILTRAVDAQGHSPVAVTIRGDAYNRVGRWQQLQLANAPKLLADQVRVLRATPGSAIDAHEAYVDAIVLVVPGSPTGTEVGTDELEVDGVLVSAAQSAGRKNEKRVQGTRTSSQPFSPRPFPGAALDASNKQKGDSALAGKTGNVRLRGTTLIVDGKAFLPRAVTWNGESLQFLSSCGFNVIELRGTPTQEQIAEAEKYGLWFLCSPLHPDALERGGAGRAEDRVLAWHLRDEALEIDPNYAIRWAEAVREHDEEFGRPIVITPELNWAGSSKAADILIAEHPRIGLMSQNDLHWWLESCPKKARPGTPLWMGVATQSNEGVRRQVSALTHTNAAPQCIDTRQLESVVQRACTEEMRGFVFRSSSSLGESDDATKQRIATLQLINRRLQLIEPWVAGGKVVQRVTSTDGSKTGVLLHVDRAGLLVQLPDENLWHAHAGTNSTGGTSKDFVFTVPGVSESIQVFYLSPAGMRALPSQRITGGTRITLPGGGADLVLMTEDPQVIQSLRQRVARDGPKTVQIEHDLAVQKSQAFARAGQRLAQLGYNSDSVTREATAINQQIAQLDTLLTSGQLEQAHDLANAIMRKLEGAMIESERAICPPAGLDSNPLATSADTLAEFAALNRTIYTMRSGDNLLVGGDFEDLRQLTQFGWQHFASPAANVETGAELSTEEPKHGSYCLELSARAKSKKETPFTAGRLVSIVSPPIAIDANKIVEITGWARVDSSFSGDDGLEIADSLGGTALAIVVGQTAGWQPFHMIRATTEPTQLQLTFSVAGLGAAKVDAVMVRTLDEPTLRRLPAAPLATPSTPGAKSASATAGPGLMAPPTR
jgi:hypothetical protein